VAIVDHGKVIALGSPRELIIDLGGEHVIEFALQDDNGQAALESASFEKLPAVRSVRREGAHFCLSVTEPHLALPALLNRLQAEERELVSLTTRHASLEDVFVRLTGRHLRDGEASSS
jgi:ABC-2 type transport system ATP-binding protein